MLKKMRSILSANLATQVLFGFLLGILVGLFFGEMAAWLKIVGDIYIGLFQMPVIPYVVVSLIAGIGNLSYQRAKSLFISAGSVLLLLWAIVLLVILVMPLAFPNWLSASFFSTSLLEMQGEFNFVELFVPSNPFHALANTIVPAVVVFSIAMGLAVIGIDNKQGLIDLFSSLAESLAQITQFIAKLAPFGVFAIAASAAGTLSLEEFGRLQVYIVLQATVALLLSFWVLPALVALLTPLRYGEIIVTFRAPLITAFAIAASAAGTLSLEEVGKLQVYIVLQATVALLLSFWILPALVALLTPLHYGEIIVTFRAPLITAFATANLLVVLPILTEKSKDLLSRIEPAATEPQPDTESPVDVIVPASFNFPNSGKLLSLAFLPFAGWYIGSSLSVTQYPLFVVAGVASFFGDGTVAMRFLLTLMHLPSDLLQLYITVDQISAARFGTLLAAMHTVVLALLGTCAMNGWITVRRRPLLRFGMVTALALALTLGFVHAFFTYGVTNTYTKDRVLGKLELLRVRDSRPTEIFRSPPQPLPPLTESQPSRLVQIEERGILRVCYEPDNYPFSYFNAKDELVGFHVEMAHILARELGLHLEFAPLFWSGDLEGEAARHLETGYCNIVMTNLPTTPSGLQRMRFSNSVLDQTLALIVEDYRKTEFTRWSDIGRIEPLRLGIPTHIPYYVAKLRGLLPQAEVTLMDSVEWKTFWESGNEEIDVLVNLAEEGAAWTLLYPTYSIAIPQPVIVVPTAYALPKDEEQLTDIVNVWLDLKQKDGTIESLYNYWVQGQIEAVKPPRWSIVRDVLHWID